MISVIAGTPTIELTAEPSAADIEAVAAELVAFNRPFMGPADFCRLGVLARQDVQLVGGLVGETARGFLFVELLWVASEYRHAGLGTRLLQTAEEEAVARGCGFVLVDTFDFQARPFYERHGYRVVGELAGFPNGHVRFTLLKQLGRDA